ncbi:MAG: hypothetical protein SGBAC_005750 [Bacillariaceae sp.]
MDNKETGKALMPISVPSSSVASSAEAETETEAETESKPRRRRRLIWHRRDLRLHDNALYSIDANGPKRCEGDTECEFSSSSIECISLFIFDAKYFQPQPSLACPKEYDTLWCGPHAAQATIEAVHSLRRKLRAIGGELLVRIGDPTNLIPQLVEEELKVDEIVFGEEPGTYERAVAQQIHHRYWNQNPRGGRTDHPSCVLPSTCYPSIAVKSVVGYTLFHPDDLPAHPDQWSKLAHPKQQKSKKKQKNQTANAQPPINSLDDNRVDVSPERFKGMCRIMGDFRKAARSSAKVRQLYKEPRKIILPSTAVKIDSGKIPTLEDLMTPALKSTTTERTILGMDRSILAHAVNQIAKRRDVYDVNIPEKDSIGKTGRDPVGLSSRPDRTEDAALQRLDDFISSGRAAVADRSRVDVVANDHSSRFSVHLALGTLSPRAIYWKVQQQQQQQREQQGEQERGSCCQWLVSHLEMRDFFLYTAFANDKYLFSANGISRRTKRKQSSSRSKNKKSQKNKSGKEFSALNDPSAIVWKSPAVYQSTWTRWSTGKTHFPLIDAAMRELMATGYCSNRVRQNVASFLTKDLQLDWRAGAEWFQFWLEDHCVGANYGNWLYFSGVGPDPKNRHFRSISQMKKYDHCEDSPAGSYVQKWVPELCVGIPVEENREMLFRPWDFGVPGFEDPIVDPNSQYIWQDAQRLEETGNLLEDRA